MEFDNVHGGHCKSSTVNHATNVSIQGNVVLYGISLLITKGILKDKTIPDSQDYEMQHLLRFCLLGRCLCNQKRLFDGTRRYHQNGLWHPGRNLNQEINIKEHTNMNAKLKKNLTVSTRILSKRIDFDHRCILGNK